MSDNSWLRVVCRCILVMWCLACGAAFCTALTHCAPTLAQNYERALDSCLAAPNLHEEIACENRVRAAYGRDGATYGGRDADADH